MGAQDHIVRRTITVDEYHKMAEAGVFRPGERIELIDGELIEMPPIGSRHFYRVNELTEYFILKLAGRAIVSIQHPIVLLPRSQPDPDVVILKMTENRYRDQLPQGEDTLLVIEVSDTTLQFDRDRKTAIYGAHGITETWVIDVNAESLLVFRKPEAGVYQETLVLEKHESVTPDLLPDLNIAVADLLA